jgi:hypothetical protein
MLLTFVPFTRNVWFTLLGIVLLHAYLIYTMSRSVDTMKTQTMKSRKIARGASVSEEDAHLEDLVRFAFFDSNLHSGMPLVPTPAR